MQLTMPNQFAATTICSPLLFNIFMTHCGPRALDLSTCLATHTHTHAHLPTTKPFS